MPVYRIAGLTVYMEPKGDMLRQRAEQYRLYGRQFEKEGCDIVLDPKPQGFLQWAEGYRQFTFESNEYTWYGFRFYSELVRHGGFFLHASAVALDGKAYLFSADSGTGKSTHTRLWTEYFGPEHCFIINDDKPALIRGENGFYACGTPFSGKHDISRNVIVPVQALCFLEQAKENSIIKIGSKEATQRIFTQIMRTSDRAVMEELLSMLDVFLSGVPVYVLRCDISKKAVETALDAMKS